MSDLIFSEDQEQAYNTIAKWIANGGKIHPNQKNPLLLSMGGFAGTGKTTIVSALAKDFGKAVRFAFCALSGRAASVLGRNLKDHGIEFNEGNHYCGTIHGLIYQPIENEDGEIIYWARKEKLDFDFIVLDEASMISESIFKDLSSYGIQILAVGDHGQLPPIEGRFSLMAKPHIKLEKIHRQAADNPIINLSMLIRQQGNIPKNYKNNDKITIVKKKDLVSYMNSVFKESQNPRETLRTAVLCYMNATRSRMNTMIRRMIFGNLSNIPIQNDVVICLRNAIQRKNPLYNGFRGFIKSPVDEYDEHFWDADVEFPYEGFETHTHKLLKYQFGHPKKFSSFSDLEKFGMEVKSWSQAGLFFDYGYAMTVHKAQGSQMDNVILFNERPGPVSDDNYKRWLYTAVSRATNTLTVII